MVHYIYTFFFFSFISKHLLADSLMALSCVQRYYGDAFESDTVVHKTKRFLVFKEKENAKRHKDMYYTENIGDLCIFLGHGEPMCVPASSSPGLKPNCIYFAGHNFGVYDITTQTITLFYTEEGPLRSTAFPYWPHPFSLTPT